MFFFPECDKRVPGSMTGNLEQHHMFMEGFTTMESYFTQVKKDPSIYDAKRVTGMIENFGNVFTRHLREEISTLEPSRMREIFPVQQELKETLDKMVEWIVSTASKLTTMPWVPSLAS